MTEISFASSMNQSITILSELKANRSKYGCAKATDGEERTTVFSLPNNFIHQSKKVCEPATERYLKQNEFLVTNNQIVK